MTLAIKQSSGFFAVQCDNKIVINGYITCLKSRTIKATPIIAKPTEFLRKDQAYVLLKQNGYEFKYESEPIAISSTGRVDLAN